jgi:hypothetical protein
MDDFIESIYIRELLMQCQYAVDAIRRMNEILAAHDCPSEFFREAGDFLQHSSAVSRLLWPPGSTSRAKKKRAKQRGAHLRRTLKVDDTHMLRTRALRDHFEHLDERLDDWAETSAYRNIVDNMIGPRTAIWGDSIRDQDIIRMFDPSTELFVFRGEQFDVRALVNGLTDVQSRATERLAQLEANRQLQATRMNPRAPEPHR